MTQPQPTERPPSTGGGLTSKIGPLPVWGWVALAVVGGVVVLLYLRSRNAASTTNNAAGSAPTPQDAEIANLQDELATVVSQIRDIQGTPGPTGPPGPIGPPGGIGPPGSVTPPIERGPVETPVPVPNPVRGPYLHTTVKDGKKLTELLNAFNISQAQFEQDNPTINKTYRWYKPGLGYRATARTPGAYLALNVGQDTVVNLPAGTPGGW